MNAPARDGGPRATPSVYYAESFVNCSIQKAWQIMLDYEAWNPTFVGAQVIPVRGEPRTEGELVLIKKSLTDVEGEPLPEFYAETVKVVPGRRIVWYVYPKDGDDFRNFVDFALTETSPGGVRFNIDYYAQDRLPEQLLTSQREDYRSGLQKSALAFKAYCESHV